MRIPDQTITDIVEHLDIVGLMNSYVTLKNKGGRWWGLCPYHTEKTASFSVQPDKGLFYCFGCNKGGTIFNFIMDMENLSFVEAVKFLGKKAGITVETGEGIYSSAEEEKRNTLVELYGRVADSLHFVLMKSPGGERARRYLAERKITEESIEAFNLGYVPPDREWLFRFLRKQNYSESFLADSGLFSRKNSKYSSFSGRIMFPIATVHNTVIAFGGRSLGSEEPKYYNSPESGLFKKRETLYGLNRALKEIKKQGTFILTEGYFDVIMLHQAGFTTCIAPLGTAFTDNQAGRMKRYVDNGILLFDGDEAGIRATEKSISVFEKAGLMCTVVELPGKDDPADYLEKHGAEALQKLLKYPINSFDYLVQKAAKRYDTASLEGKEQFLRSLIPYITIIQSDTRRESCIQVLAEMLEVDYQSVSRDIQRWSRGTGEKKADGQSISVRGEISIQLFLLLAVSVFREYFVEVRQELSVDDFSDQRARDLFIALEECYRRGEASVDSLLSKLHDPEVRKMVLEKSGSSEFYENTEKLIRDSMDTIKRGSLEKKRRKIELLLREYEEEGRDLREVKDLLNEKIYYDRELERLKGTGHE